MVALQDGGSMPLNAQAKQCEGKSRRTGSPCQNPAVTGSNYCRLHGGGALGNRSRTGLPKPPGSGGAPPKKSQNARRHGAYSENLTPEEQQLLQKILAGYIQGIRRPSKAEREVLHRLSFLETKWNTALNAGAPYRALNYLHRLVWDLTQVLAAIPRTFSAERKHGKTPLKILYALSQRMWADICTPRTHRETAD